MAQCRAKTQKGSRCKGACVKGTNYCLFHQRKGVATFRNRKPSGKSNTRTYRKRK